MKDLSKIIRDFEKLPYKSYERRRPKNDPTDSYFYPETKLAECNMRADALNLHVYPVRMEMAGTKQIQILNVCSTDESKSEDFLVDKTLSQVSSMDKEESKIIIVDESSTEESE